MEDTKAKNIFFVGGGLKKRYAEEKNRGNYYPFGMQMPERGYEGTSYRYGFNGMEKSTFAEATVDKDNEVKGSGNSYTTLFRQYDPRLGRWLSIDPVVHEWQSPYCAFDNNPIYIKDPTGADGDPPYKNNRARRKARRKAKKSCPSFRGGISLGLNKPIKINMRKFKLKLFKVETDYQWTMEDVGTPTQISQPRAGQGLNNVPLNIGPFPAGATQVGINYEAYGEPDNFIIRVVGIPPNDPRSIIAQTGDVGDNISVGSGRGFLQIPNNAARNNQLTISVVPRSPDGVTSFGQTMYNAQLTFRAPTVYKKRKYKVLGITIWSKYTKITGNLAQRVINNRNGDTNNNNDVVNSTQYQKRWNRRH